MGLKNWTHHSSGPVIERILTCLHLLFMDTEQLTKRYGLRESTSGQISAIHITGPRVDSIAFARFKESFERFRARTNANQRQTGVARRARWAIHDRSRFAMLVDDLRQFVNGLWTVTESPVIVDSELS